MTDTYCIDYDDYLTDDDDDDQNDDDNGHDNVKRNDDVDSMSLFNGSKRTLSNLDDIQSQLFQLNL